MTESPINETQPAALSAILSDALRYWERRRIWYNLLLTVVVAAWLVSTWPHFRSMLSMRSVLLLVILAAMANLRYCAAYVADLPMQFSLFQAVWRRRRWGLWVAGMVLAIALADYWIADEVYPYVS